jgi:predicted SprT family Zn-dependent metalloprotease
MANAVHNRLLKVRIVEGNLTQVRNFIETFPRDKLVYDEGNNSVVAIALRAKQFDIYELLLSQKFKLGPHEKFEEIMKELDATETFVGSAMIKRRRLREIHLKFVKESTLKHLYDLNLKSKLSHSTVDGNRRKYHELIWKAYEELNELKLIQPILKVVSADVNLQIIFDFDRPSVDHMDPTKHEFTFGTTYPSISCIYIGAKALLHGNLRFITYGTLAHELCHLAIMIVFGNECKPYRVRDEEMKNEFEEIVKLYENQENSERIISDVFGYPPDVWHAELIVRVPHVMAFYKDDDDKLMECQEKCSELFDYYQEHVYDKMIREYEIVEVAHDLMEQNFISYENEDNVSVESFKNKIVCTKALKMISLIITLITATFLMVSFLWSANTSANLGSSNIQHVQKYETLNVSQEFSQFSKSKIEAYEHGNSGFAMWVSSSHGVQADYDFINATFNHPQVADRKVVAFSIVGSLRKGKSFFMSYFLRFMYANVS